ncbi:hypothetical protein MTHERMMSTA1_07700 [Methanosarcina thermophila MST-A1]|jgi:hypothetical protein|uniref:Uncharacterized protein n=1 Tax=Methanosarcina thermophila TaxID=2210 RepID=A0A3G9CWE9_METTE|nr:hypothetical protein [Methanosarcina thermophila]NLU56167.1 hypothetical protein [Methanosarcina thermophila]BAW29309.1 putative conserved hypothetical protein [Methanosarcina thermophila]GLI13644.1 hypothetical protein MTHERMMSTA1_07700 [Methanosarcina thermophila MST-A1]
MIFDLELQNDLWMDNAIVNFYSLLSSLGHDTVNISIITSKVSVEILDYELFLSDLSQAIIRKIKPNIIIDEIDKNSNERKEIKKDYILIQENKKINGKVSLKEKIYDENDNYQVIREIFDFLEGDSKKCVFCGRNFKKSVKNLQQASYPFVTKIKSLSGIRGVTEYFKDYCPICYLIGILEWQDPSLIYRTFPADKSYLFLPLMLDLNKLYEFKCNSVPVLDNTYRYSNLSNLKRESTENTPGKYSTLLYFYEKFNEKFMDTYTEESPICTQWGIVEIPLSGSVKNPKLTKVVVPDYIIGLIRILANRDFLIYNDFIRNIRMVKLQGKSDFEETNIIREKLSESIIKDEFRLFAKQFLPRKKERVVMNSLAYEVLEELLLEWRCRPMGINKEDLDNVKSYANVLASVTSKNISLLYKLDKARDINEFWSITKEISKKLIDAEKNDISKIRPTSIDNLVLLVKENEDDWKEIRDLIIIYASMYHSIRNLKQEG